MKAFLFALALVCAVAEPTLKWPFFAPPPINMTTTPINITALITGFGYPCEEYQTLTSDGWWLKIDRIPPIKAGAPVVFFMHGLLDSAAGVCLNGPPESLPFILHDNGYDVYLGNNRGNKVSVENIYYNDTQEQYWDWSFDEMATIDLPTMLYWVLNFTNVSTLSYIGHSEGTTQAFIGFTDPALTARVNIYIALAPIVTIGNTGSIVLKDAADAYLDVIAMHEGVLKIELTNQEQQGLSNECAKNVTVCYEIAETLFGPSTHENVTDYPYYALYFPAASSMKNMAHWFQWVRSDKYCMYDYGPQGNMQHYGQPEPPNYNISAIPPNFPIALVSGGNDYLADPTDVAALTAQLNAPGRLPPLQYYISTYAHVDFILAYDAMDLLFPWVLDVLAQYNPGA